MYYRVITVYPELPDTILRLREFAYNYWISWNAQALALFHDLDPGLWEAVNHNPVKLLLKVKQEALFKAAENPGYLDRYLRVGEAFDRYLSEDAWLKLNFPQYAAHTIAYFSAEFGLHEAHPFYSGGLGLLAGDHCKASSDAGIPLMGVSLLYRQGYFTQVIDRDGWQKAVYPYQNFYELPLELVCSKDGSPLTVNVKLEGENVTLFIWRVRVGRISLYLLDADNPYNSPEKRMLTYQLYGGDHKMRIDQEVLLGMGGVRALRAVGINPSVFHINEGHASLALLERVRELVQKGLDAPTAMEYIRASTVFTTHTPVPAGHDVFSLDMIDRHFGSRYSEFGLERGEFISLGWDERKQGFNMTVLAMRMAGYVNGVSRLHQEVTRRMFDYLYKDIPQEEIPVDSITNGVHTLSWMAQEIRELLDEHLGTNWPRYIYSEQFRQKCLELPCGEVSAVHQALKRKMIQTVRTRLTKQYQRNHEPLELIEAAKHFLDPQALTIGFARRFATYKRALLLFQDLDRLDRLVNDPQRPVQLIFAGKAHPADRPGQEIIKFICDQARSPRFMGRIIFVEDYDINLARVLLQGVDVWLNTPRRPLEASGTSGQKAAVNFVLNLSVLDGWWPEAYNGENGFAIGRKNYPDEETQDQEDRHALFTMLEETVVPLYYRQNTNSNAWTKRMKASLATILPAFSADKMVKTYAARFYFPAIERSLRCARDNFVDCAKIQRFKAFMKDNWHGVKIAQVITSNTGKFFSGQEIPVQAVVHLGKISYRDVVVEFVLGTVLDNELQGISLTRLDLQKEIDEGIYCYEGKLGPSQGVYGYTVRVRPSNPDFLHTFELPLVTWAGAF